MGVTLEIHNILNKYSRLKSNKLDLLELGDQMVYDDYFAPQGSKYRDVVKHNYNKYVTYDLWNSSGVTLVDLSQTLETKEKFDIITNFGTTEHVEPELGQYKCWVNIHNLLKLDGLLINEVPTDNNFWLGHCRYYYKESFFNAFKKIGYDLLELKIAENKCCISVLQKKKDLSFMNCEIFYENIYFDKTINSNIIASMNNPKGLNF